GDGGRHVIAGNEGGDAFEPARVIGAELGQPVIVRPENGLEELRVGHRVESNRGAGEEDVDVNAIEIGILGTGSREPPARPLVIDHATELFRIPAGRLVAGVAQVHALAEPEVAFTKALDVWRPVLQSLREPRCPQIRWLHDVGVTRVDGVRTNRPWLADGLPVVRHTGLHWSKT